MAPAALLTVFLVLVALFALLVFPPSPSAAKASHFRRRRLRIGPWRAHKHNYQLASFADPKSVRQRTPDFLSASPPTDGNAATGRTCAAEDVGRLIAAIGSDPERFALRPYAEADEGGGASGPVLPGFDANLIRDAFRGKKIFIYGDSTTRNLNLWLHLVLSQKYLPRDGSAEELLSSLSTMDLGEANRVLVLATGGKCKIHEKGHVHLWCRGDGGPGREPQTVADGGATLVKFVGLSKDPGRPPCGDELEWPLREMREFRPDVAMVNLGLWLLHFQTLGKDLRACVAETWMGYEQWLEAAVRAAEESGAGVLVFKTTNFICHEYYIRGYKRAVKPYLRRDEGVLQGCFNDLRAKISGTIGDNAIRDFCEMGQFDDVGSTHLNRRLAEFVDARQRNPATTVRINILNDHDMQSCKSTQKSDGRHHHLLNLARIRVLGNLLTCNGAMA